MPVHARVRRPRTGWSLRGCWSIDTGTWSIGDLIVTAYRIEKRLLEGGEGTLERPPTMALPAPVVSTTHPLPRLLTETIPSAPEAVGEIFVVVSPSAAVVSIRPVAGVIPGRLAVEVTSVR